MQIDENYIWRLLQRTNQWIQGVDYLGLACYEELKFATHYFQLLDCDNSNQAIHYGKDNTYTISKSSANNSRLLVSIAVDGVAYPIIELHSFPGCIECKYGICFYGTLYRLIERGDLNSFNNILGDLFENQDVKILESSTVSRLDYKIDLCYTNQRRIHSLNKIVKKRKDTGYHEFSLTERSHQDYKDRKNIVAIERKIKNGEKFQQEQIQKQKDGEYLNGWIVGKKNSKTVKIRCYDKILDSLAKGRYGLYDDYFQYGSVYRLECEFRAKFLKCEFGEPVLLKDIDILISKAKSYMGIGEKRNSNYFYRPNFDLQSLNISYFTRYANAGERILKNKICPFEVQSLKLIEKGYTSTEVLFRLNTLYKKLQKQFGGN